MTRAPVLLVIALAVASFASAQPVPTVQPTTPTSPGFLTAFVPYASFSVLSAHDEDLYWDGQFAVGIDAWDYGRGRAHASFSYETLMGNEFQPFDPRIGDYTIDLLGTVRHGRTEWGAYFEHVSRHLSDRRKDFGIAWDDLGIVLLREGAGGKWTWKARGVAAGTIARGFVDYRGLVGGDGRVYRTVSSRWGLIGSASAKVRFVGTEPAVSRDPQFGGLLEAGIRINGRGPALELLGGVERRIDADPLAYAATTWAFVGARIIKP